MLGAPVARLLLAAGCWQRILALCQAGACFAGSSAIANYCTRSGRAACSLIRSLVRSPPIRRRARAHLARPTLTAATDAANGSRRVAAPTPLRFPLPAPLFQARLCKRQRPSKSNAIVRLAFPPLGRQLASPTAAARAAAPAACLSRSGRLRLRNADCIRARRAKQNTHKPCKRASLAAELHEVAGRVGSDSPLASRPILNLAFRE